MTTAFVCVVAFALGTCVGSFLNVVSWRVPRGESVVSPPSHCPACNAPLTPIELIPVLSWIALRGRCRHCGSHISARYPLIELGIGMAFAIIAWAAVS